MTTFSYSSGDPTNLVAAATASMADIKGPFDDIKTFFNAATIDTTNLATSAKPVTLLGAYRAISEACTQYDDADVSGANMLGGGGLLPSGTSASSTTNRLLFAVDPADYSVSGLTAKFRLKAAVVANATAPAITFTFGLYPVTVAGGTDTVAVTLGTVTSGSTVAIASPSASTATVGTGTDFTPPTAGVYALGVALSVNLNGNNACGLLYARLDVRHV